MFNRRKSDKDTPVVRALFELHDLLNQEGKHWMKHHFKEKISGEWCFCLAGGVHYLQHLWPPDTSGLMFEFLAAAIPEWPEFVDEGDPEGACIRYNDFDSTKWPDIETVIHNAIGGARKRKVAA